MFFRNLAMYRFAAGVIASVDAFQTALGEHRLREVGPLEISTRGFISPFGRESDDLALVQDGCALCALGGSEKILPAAVVADELGHRIAAIADREGRRPGAKERKRMKEEIISEFLPRAFVRSTRTLAYVDVTNGWLVVDTASRRVAEDVVCQIREALGRFPVTPLCPEESPRNLMTGWLIDGRTPPGIVLGEDCELRDPAEAGAIVRCCRQDLESDEVREHLKSGKQVFQLGAVFNDRLSFVLGEDLAIRKLRFLDIVLDELGEGTAESIRAEMDSKFALMRLELRELLRHLVDLFAIAQPGEEKLKLDGGDAPKHMRGETPGAGPNANIHTKAFRDEFTASARKKGLRVCVSSAPNPIEFSLDHLPNVTADEKAWLSSGRRGASSDAMFHRFKYGVASTADSHPLDPDDLRRCRMLLESVPAFQPRLSELAAISPVWARLVDNWEALCVLMDAECDWRSGKGSAPKTYDFMNKLGC